MRVPFVRESTDVGKTKVDYSPALIGLAVLLLYLLLQFTLQGAWLLRPGMWAENGTNYFRNAADGFQISDLAVTDSGYLPIILRLLSAGIELVGVPDNLVPSVQQIIGLLLVVLPSILFIHPVFRRVIYSDMSRGLIALVILILQSSWGMALFLNATYSFLFFLFTLVLLISRSEISGLHDKGWVPTGWWWFAPLAVFSKPAVLAVVPLFLLFAVVKRGRIRTLSVLIVSFAIIQASVLAYSRFALGVFDRGVPFSPLGFFASVPAYVFGISSRLFFGPWVGEPLPVWITVGMGCGLLVGLAFLSRRLRTPEFFNLVLYGVTLSFLSSAFNGLTVWSHWNPGEWEFDSVPIHPHSWGVYLGLIVCLIATIAEVSKRLARRFENKALEAFIPSILVLTWLSFSGWPVYMLEKGVPPAWPTTQNSQWSEHFVENPNSQVSSDCVLIDPWGWVYGDRCEVPDWTNPASSGVVEGDSFLWSEDAFEKFEKDQRVLGVAVGVSPGSSRDMAWTLTAKNREGEVISHSRGSNNPVRSDKTLLFVFENSPPAGQIATLILRYDGFDIRRSQSENEFPDAVHFFVLEK